MKTTSCFFMLCTNVTEKECIERGLFGDLEWRIRFLSTIKKGDIGFLLNVFSDQLLGIFQAESSAQLNLIPDAWGGRFPAQVKVKLIGELQRIDNATEKIGRIVRLRKIRKEPFSYKIPAHDTYGPEITEQILSFFKKPNDLEKVQPQPIEVGISPQYTLDDVAGLDDVKNFIYQRIIAPFEDEKVTHSLKLRIGGGMLLFGPPGTGKTLISMSIARNIQAKFIDISPSIIIGYPGEAEKRLESIFAALEKEPRAVIFFDEAEWVLRKRETQASSVMQRITPLLLAQLSRIFKEKMRPIIVIAATNKPQEIDPAFLRPGRFDKKFYIGLPDENARKKIIKLQLKDRANRVTDDEIIELSQKLDGYSGADIENIIEGAAFKAFTRRDEMESEITKEDIKEVIDETPKSVTQDEVEKIKKWAKERGVKI